MSRFSKTGYREKSTLERLYHQEEMSLRQIASRFDVTDQTILRWMRKHEIERRDKKEASQKGGPEKLQDKKWLRKKYWDDELTTPEIADLLGVAHSTVQNWMERLGIERRSRSIRQYHPVNDPSVLENMYWDRGLSLHEVANELGVDHKTVVDRMKRFNIRRRTRSESACDGDLSPLRNAQWVWVEYVAEQKSAYQIASDLECSVGAVFNWIERHGFENRSLSKSHIQGRSDLLDDESWMVHAYEEVGMSTGDIGDRIGVSASTVCKKLKSYGVEIRGPTDGRSASVDDRQGGSWTATRREVIERDDRKCRRCGLTNAEHESEYGSGLHVHHIIPRSGFPDSADKSVINDPQNLISLCGLCHLRVELKTENNDWDTKNLIQSRFQVDLFQ